MADPTSEQFAIAIHELGHALIACALDLPFSGVKIWQNDKLRWEGKCYMEDEGPSLSEAETEAFNMAGALLQTILAPASLGENLRLFQSSLFSNARQLKAEPNLLTELGWSIDFGKGHFVDHALDSLRNGDSERPQLFELEQRIRSFFKLPSVQQLALELAHLLADSATLEPDFIKQKFAVLISPDLSSGLQEFIKTIPDQPSDAAFWADIRANASKTDEFPQ